jgi:putative transposase
MKSKETQLAAFRQAAMERLREGAPMLGKEGVFTPLLKSIIESSLSAELDGHLADGEEANRRNGTGKKRVQTPLGEVEIEPPQDRNRSFDPKLIRKRQRSLGEEFDRLVLTMYAKGNSYSDIRDYLEELYGLEISTATLSRVTDKILPLVQEWKGREPESAYPFSWLDAIHYKVREEGRVIGVNQEGHKELLGPPPSSPDPNSCTEFPRRGVRVGCPRNRRGCGLAHRDCHSLGFRLVWATAIMMTSFSFSSIR